MLLLKRIIGVIKKISLNILIAYMVIAAFLKIIGFVLECFNLFEYFYTVLLIIIFILIMIFRRIFFYTPYEITLSSLMENYEKWNIARETNNFYLFFLKLCRFFGKKHILYYDRFYCDLYFRWLWYQLVFQNTSFTYFIYSKINEKVSPLLQKLVITLIIIQNYRKERRLWYKKVGYIRGFLILKLILQNVTSEYPKPFIKYFLDEWKVEQEELELNRAKRSKLPKHLAFKENFKKEKKDVVFSPLYSKFRYVLLHYAIIIVWLLPVNNSLKIQWFDRFILFKNYKFERFLQDTAGYLEPEDFSVYTPLSVSSDNLYQWYDSRSDECEFPPVDEYLHNLLFNGECNLEECNSHGFLNVDMDDFELGQSLFDDLMPSGLEEIYNPDGSFLEEKIIEFEVLLDLMVTDPFDYPDRSIEDFFFDVHDGVGVEDRYLEVEDTLALEARGIKELAYEDCSDHVPDYSQIYGKTVENLENVTEMNYPYPVRDFGDDWDDFRKGKDMPQEMISASHPRDYSIDEIEFARKIHNYPLEYSYVYNISAIFIVMFWWLQVVLTLIIISRRIQLLMFGVSTNYKVYKYRKTNKAPERFAILMGLIIFNYFLTFGVVLHFIMFLIWITGLLPVVDWLVMIFHIQLPLDLANVIAIDGDDFTPLVRQLFKRGIMK